jgi:hypothetical protein
MGAPDMGEAPVRSFCRGRGSGRVIGPPPTQKTIFVHIPKCGGQAFETVLEGLYWKTPFVRFLPDGIAMRAPADATRPDVRLRESEFEKFTADELYERFSGIWGHIPFSKYAKVFRGSDFARWNFVTILRNPVELYVSLYNYVRGYKEHPSHKKFANASLRQFMEVQGVHNFQCGFATGEYSFEKARDVLLTKYTAFCVLDDLFPFTEVFSNFVKGHTKRPLKRINVSDSYEVLNDLSADDLEWLMTRVREDYLLVEWARNAWRGHFRDAMAAKGFPIDEERLRHLELGNWAARDESSFRANRAF